MILGFLHDSNLRSFTSLQVFRSQIVLNFVNSQNIDSLSMTSILLVSLSPLFLENNNFFRLRVFFNSSQNMSISNAWSTNSCILCSANHKYVVKSNLLSNFKRNLFNHYLVIHHNFVLHSQEANNSKDFFWMGWKGHTNLCIMNVYYWFLRFDRFLFSLSLLPFLSFESFLLQREFPCIASLCVLFVLNEFVKNFFTIFFIKISEELTEA